MITLEEILTGVGQNCVDPLSLGMGKVLKLQMQQKWQEAAEVAYQQVIKFPTRNFVMQESFSWLCADNPQMAEQAFLNFAKPIKLFQGEPVAWLKAFISVKNGDLQKAEENLKIYLGSSLRATEKIDESFLLDLWNNSVSFKEAGNVAFYFPTLPPSLTGFECSVTRSQSEVPLDLSQYKSLPVPKQETQLSLSSSITSDRIEPNNIEEANKPRLVTQGALFMNNIKNLSPLAKVGVGISLAVLVGTGLITLPEILLKDPIEETETLIDFNIVIYDESNNEFLEGVKVSFTPKGSPIEKYTDSQGYVKIELPSTSSINIRLSKNGFKPETYTIDVENDPNQNREYKMKPES